MKYACDDESAETGSESRTEASGTEDEDSLRPLSLTKEEVLFIDDMLSLMIVASEGQDPFGTQVTTMRRLTPRTGLPAPLEIVEKIAYAVLFTTDPDCRLSAKMGQIGGVENPRVLRWCELLEWG